MPSAEVVVDTNVLLALWLFRDPVVEPLHAAFASGQLRPVRSAATDAEFAEVLARPAANSGVYFHTAFQDTDWPRQGYEVQVNHTATGEGGYREGQGEDFMGECFHE